jgi:anti-sigma factor RsiW
MDELNAFLDGQLGPEAAARVEARIAADPQAAERFAAYARHKALLAEAATTATPVVENLRTAALERALAQKLAGRADEAAAWRVPAWARRLPAAAALVLAGWFGHQEYAAWRGGVPDYVSEAVGAHRVFAEDRIRPVEFASDAGGASLGWISAKLGRTVEAPSLEALGMRLVGVRMLGTREGALAQFIYEDDAGARLSLTLARHPDDAPAVDVETAALEDAQVAYWSDRTFDYALVAKTTDTQIRAIASELGASVSF